jgi:hypothetical protein
VQALEQAPGLGAEDLVNWDLALRQLVQGKVQESDAAGGVKLTSTP